ncbi:hypothetical protein WN48_06702 [Eufriesea mexicana]|uniref:Uncharacterized protein n=1 Tax=Eufriesea mexicana TaxID=516756 RepID=A0A310SHB1_9HYME|nr:hypothetical protein WN48_06702 [Eufriesea mexicana]
MPVEVSSVASAISRVYFESVPRKEVAISTNVDNATLTTWQEKDTVTLMPGRRLFLKYEVGIGNVDWSFTLIPLTEGFDGTDTEDVQEWWKKRLTRQTGGKVASELNQINSGADGTDGNSEILNFNLKESNLAEQLEIYFLNAQKRELRKHLAPSYAVCREDVETRFIPKPLISFIITTAEGLEIWITFSILEKHAY